MILQEGWAVFFTLCFTASVCILGMKVENLRQLLKERDAELERLRDNPAPRPPAPVASAAPGAHHCSTCNRNFESANAKADHDRSKHPGVSPPRNSPSAVDLAAASASGERIVIYQPITNTNTVGYGDTRRPSNRRGKRSNTKRDGNDAKHTGKKQSGGKPCRYGTDCNRPHCKFTHPHARNVDDDTDGGADDQAAAQEEDAPAPPGNASAVGSSSLRRGSRASAASGAASVVSTSGAASAAPSSGRAAGRAVTYAQAASANLVSGEQLAGFSRNLERRASGAYGELCDLVGGVRAVVSPMGGGARSLIEKANAAFAAAPAAVLKGPAAAARNRQLSARGRRAAVGAPVPER